VKSCSEFYNAFDEEAFDACLPKANPKRARTQIGERHDELSKAVLETHSETGDTADRSTHRSPHRSREQDGTVTV
jgi:hypothetical protein